MEILVVTWNFPPRCGGMEQLLAALCEGLGKNHRLFIITSHADNADPDQPGIFRPRYPGLLAFFFYSLWQGALLLRCYRGIRVVFGGSVLVTPLTLILARLFGRKAIIQCHGLDLLYPKIAYQHLVVRWLRFCDHVISNSRYTALLAKDKGVAEQSMTIIPPGVHWQKFVNENNADALKLERGLQGKKIILFVGRLAPRKGVKEFIEKSLVQIIQEIPEACFLIVGDNPSESLIHRDDVRSEIASMISVCHLEEKVHWLGAVSDEELVKIYHLCDLVVLPVLEMKDDVEGFGIVALEAAAAGKPVVATSVGGIPDAVEDGLNGILVQPGDYKNFSQTIVGLLSSGEKAAAMGESGRRRISKEFTWSKIVARYDAAFYATTVSVNESRQALRLE